jgi:hypothetical protein
MRRAMIGLSLIAFLGTLILVKPAMADTVQVYGTACFSSPTYGAVLHTGGANTMTVTVQNLLQSVVIDNGAPNSNWLVDYLLEIYTVQGANTTDAATRTISLD